MLKKAIQYARASTEEQDRSVRDQLDATAKYAEEHGYTIVDDPLCDEGISGVEAYNRPAFQELFKRIESGVANFKYVLVYDVSRWGRFANPNEAAAREWICNEHGISVVYTNEGFTEDNSLSNDLSKSVKRSMATEYSRALSKVVSRGMRSLAADGYWLGRAPYGYRKAEVDKDRNIIRVLGKRDRKLVETNHLILVPGDPNEIETVRYIFERSIQGDGLVKIADKLNRAGIPSPMNRLWAHDEINKILRNPAYIGTVRWGRLKLGKFPRLENSWGDTRRGMIHDQDKWSVKKNAHEAIIDEDTFERAQAAQRSRCFVSNNIEKRRNGSTLLLSGLLVCASCGGRFSGYVFSTKHSHHSRRYACNTRRKKGRYACDSKTIRREPIDQFVLRKIQAYLNDPNFWPLVERKIRGRFTGDTSVSQREKAIRKEITKVEGAIESLMDMIENRKSPNWEDLDKRLAKRREDRERLKEELERARVEKARGASVEQFVADIRAKLSDASRYLTDSKENEKDLNEVKKRIIRQFVYKGLVSPDGTKVDFYFYKVPFIDSNVGSDKRINITPSVTLPWTFEKDPKSVPDSSLYTHEKLAISPPVFEEDGRRWYRYSAYAEIRHISLDKARSWGNEGKLDHREVFGVHYVSEKVNKRYGGPQNNMKEGSERHGQLPATSQES